MNIVLMGYMGSGKSLVGKGLSESRSCDYIDLDDYIVHQEKKSISDIFKDQGEVYFRKKEAQYLKEVLQNHKNAVISLGGGTPCFAGNIEYILADENTKSVYLHTSLEELTRRLYTEKAKRPLIAHINTEEALKDFIRKHVFERSYYYNQAEYTIETDGKSALELITELTRLILL